MPNDELPPMPEPRPVLTLTLTATLDHDFEKYSTGDMRMCYERVHVSEGDKQIGTVAPAIPSGIVVSIGSRSYFVGASELWNAVQQAEQEIRT